MRSSLPITDEILMNDVKIDKPGHRSRILSKLHEDVMGIQVPSLNISLEVTSRATGCELCSLM